MIYRERKPGVWEGTLVVPLTVFNFAAELFSAESEVKPGRHKLRNGVVFLYIGTEILPKAVEAVVEEADGYEIFGAIDRYRTSAEIEQFLRGLDDFPFAVSAVPVTFNVDDVLGVNEAGRVVVSRFSL